MQNSKNAKPLIFNMDIATRLFGVLVLGCWATPHSARVDWRLLFLGMSHISSAPDLDLYSWSTSLDVEAPLLTSSLCTDALSRFFSNVTVLAIAAEASSHPSGLKSVFAQPWLYAGGGLGNVDECPLQICLAGAGLKRDSITFGSVCIVPECSARDLGADDFVAAAKRVSVGTSDSRLVTEYVTLLGRMAKLNKFLNTGWTCGDFIVPWNLFPFGYIFIALSLFFVAATWFASFRQGKATTERSKLQGQMETRSYYASLLQTFDASVHLKKLTSRHSQTTAVLDGLRVFSILWIILGHTMAIMSSSGAGYKNPANFLPPNGITNTLIGQLLFSSRFAVDSFLCISGFLLVQIANKRFPRESSQHTFLRYMKHLPALFTGRVARILPVYAMSLGFYTQIAPHLGSGPFWYQWLALLRPCHDAGWTNLLFINNFVPWDVPVTATCFYHSWYLAVDMQLFLVGVFFAFLYQAKPAHGRNATLGVVIASFLATAFLSYAREWSINTFDGAAVSRFEIEAYAKPHVRAQAYFSGMYASMLLPPSVLERRSPWRFGHRVIIVLALLVIATVTFITVTGAYGRRACQYQEWPQFDSCGSLWSPTLTFLYTAFARFLWSSSITVIMYICLGREPSGNFVARVLSWRCWVPLSHLSFAVYLIHPVIIFVWQLGDREKETFRLFSFVMNFIAVCVVSYVAALAMALIVEFPCASIWKDLVATRSIINTASPQDGTRPNPMSDDQTPLAPINGRYGSLDVS